MATIDQYGNFVGTGSLVPSGPAVIPTPPPPVTPPKPTGLPDINDTANLTDQQKTSEAAAQTKINNQGKPGYDIFGNPLAGTTSASQTSTQSSSSGNANIDALTKQRMDEADQLNALAKQTSDTLTGIQNGVVPLSAGEQAQIDGLKQQFEQMIQQQSLINTGARGLASVRGFQKGAAEYDANFHVKTIGSIVSAGAAKITNLQVQEASAVAALTQSLKDGKAKGVKDAYDVYQQAAKDHQGALKETIDAASKAIKDAQDAKAKADEIAAKAQGEIDKTKSDILLKLTQSGNTIAPAVYEAVNNAKTANEAIMAAGALLYSQSDILDAQYKKAQIAKAYSDIQANNTSGTSDAASIMAYANQYAATGQIPAGLPKGTFGTVAQVAKELPKSPGQIVSTSTGVTPTGDAALQQGMGSLYSAIELSKQLKELDQKRWDGIIAGSLGQVFGSSDQQRYLDLRSQIVDLISRARSGAALSASEEKRYNDMLPGRYSEALGLGPDSQVKIDNFISTITNDIKNKASSQGWAINGVSTVKLNGTEYKVGDIIQSAGGQQGRVNADGTITLL